jgi:hypothetical protein
MAMGAGQHAVLSLAQLRELGFTAAGVRKRCARNRLHRIHRSVYSLVPLELLGSDGRTMAAVLACGPDAVISHRSAAALHGLRRTDRSKIEVTVAGRSCRKCAGIDVHRSTALTPSDVTTVRGIPCTTVARTLLDLAAVLPRRPVERAFDQAEIEGILNVPEIQEQVRRNATHRGAGTVKAILGEHYIGRTPTESELEEAFFEVCRRFGAPTPEVNQWVDLGDGLAPIKADFLWRAQRVIVETDGARTHGTRQARERDPRRDQRAVLAGWTPIRTTWRQVMWRADELAPILRMVATRTPGPATRTHTRTPGPATRNP